MAGRPYDVGQSPSASSGGGGGASTSSNPNLMSGYYNGGHAVTMLAQSKQSSRPYCVELIIVAYGLFFSF